MANSRVQLAKQIVVLRQFLYQVCLAQPSQVARHMHSKYASPHYIDARQAQRYARTARSIVPCVVIRR